MASEHDRCGETWEFDSGLRVLVVRTENDSANFGWNHLVVVLDAGRDKDRQSSVGRSMYVSESKSSLWGTWPSKERLFQRP